MRKKKTYIDQLNVGELRTHLRASHEMDIASTKGSADEARFRDDTYEALLAIKRRPEKEQHEWGY